MATTVLITGGSGLIGTYLSNILKSKEYKVCHLTRKKNIKSEYKQYVWDIEKNEIDQEALLSADYIIHLAGESIGSGRWTNDRKQRIIDSRTKSAELMFDGLNNCKHKVRALISASGIGVYGAETVEHIFSEKDEVGNDFLAKVCVKWEASVNNFNNIGIRTVKLRTGLVLDKNAEAYKKMLLPIKLGIGSALGSGKQYMPWIHIQDLCNIYLKAIEDDKMQGEYNAVSPSYITNKDFLKTIAYVYNRPFFMPPVPSYLLKIIFGQMSCIFLKGSRVSSQKIQDAGYSFKYSDLYSAIESFCSSNKK